MATQRATPYRQQIAGSQRAPLQAAEASRQTG
jgi:hypothetical protein